MMKSILFLAKYIRQEKRFFFTGIFFTVSVSSLTWLGPKIIARIIDDGLLPANRSVTLTGVAMLAGSEAFRLFSVFFSQWMYAKLGQNVIERVRRAMVSHLMRLPISYFDRVTSGSMMTRVVNDVNSLTDFFQSGFVSILGNIASVVAIFVGIFSLSLRLGLLLTMTFLPVVLLCVYFSNRLQTVYEASRNRLSELNSKLADFLFGMRTVRALGLGRQKHQELNQNVRAYAKSQMNMIGTFAIFQPTLSLGIGAMLFVLIAVGIPMVSGGALLVGEWVAVLSYVVILGQPLMEISDRWNFFLAGLTSLARIQEVFAEQAEESGDVGTAQFSVLEFKAVNFRYQDSKTLALKNVNLKIERGDWVGIYGESGSGKSTFLQMLYGFYVPSLGEIRWNHSNYFNYRLSHLRGHFGVVEQFPFLFQGTVRENITLFHRFKLDELKVNLIFKGFPLIESLLKMLDFEISERGENLSMGQKQMITFLRAYLSVPQIWVLDEATAFFDHDAEDEVLRALDHLASQQITVIQVAHKPEALKRMRRRFRVDQGLLIEDQIELG